MRRQVCDWYVEMKGSETFMKRRVCMKRVVWIVIVVAWVAAFTPCAFAGRSMSAYIGGMVLLDPSNGEEGEGVLMTVDIPLMPGVDVEWAGGMTSSFDLENDLTHKGAKVSFMSLGGRFYSPRAYGPGFCTLGIGAIRLEADDSSLADGTRVGGVVRLGIGADKVLQKNRALRFGVGLSQGFGATSEVTLIEVSLAFTPSAAEIRNVL
ncbi:hypothetical protein [Desulfoluna spongiiphila]|uniref:hypothetical protein n=1 Tax=Desulfoluna spongiiphila TaxID=419481 RepID=UPI001255381B|nr:hypothetical protein [Desulfoluna spongiiphila]VVS90651.1 hypothetical protein DBB_2180 [Desulfoluna spongiiphila]